MALDLDVQKYLKVRSQRNLLPTHLQTPEQHRNYLDNGPFPEGPTEVNVTAAKITGRDGQPIHMRIYRPTSKAPCPILVFFHGGGWVCGTLDSLDGTMRHLATFSGMMVVSVTYRRSPEHRYPAALHDALDAVSWLETNAESIGGDPANILVGGGSAGANLAAACCLARRDAGMPPLAGQLLVYPCLDPACETESFIRNAKDYVLTTKGMKWYWEHYLGPDHQQPDQLAAPLLADDLSNLPPALIITAEYDPLLDDGKRYATALSEAQNDVTYSCYSGVVHGFFNQWHMIARGMDCLRDSADWMCQKIEERKNND